MEVVEKIESVPPARAKKGSLLPLLLIVILVPGLCYVMMDFLIVPKLQGSMLALAEATRAQAGGSTEKPKAASASRDTPAANLLNVDFGVTTVNLADAAGSRYLRVNFVVAGADRHLAEIIKENQSALRDATINVLSAQTLATLDAQGGRNIVRNQLIEQFNRTLGAELISQIYFSEFVIQ